MILGDLQLELGGKKHESFGNVLCVQDDRFDWVEPNSVDLVLTDPPFNIARDTNFHTYENNTVNSFRFDADKGWDSYSPEAFRELLRTWTLEFSRVLKPGGSFAVFCADEYLSDLISALKASGLKPRRTLTWRKPNAVPVNRKYMMMSACEYVVVGVKGSKSVFNATIDLEPLDRMVDSEVIAVADKAASVLELEIRRALLAIGHRPSASEVSQVVSQVMASHADDVARRSVGIYSEDGKSAELCVPNYVAFNSKSGRRLHPTEKPVQLLRYLTNLFSNPGGLVLDPFSGSGSTGEAALQLDRRAILVERDEEFFRKGASRIGSLLAEVESTLL
jgi:DNA modification methylase